MHVMVENLDNTIESFTVETSHPDEYDCFHSTVGVVLGNIAGENGGLENVAARFDDGSDIDTDRIELAAALFFLEDSGEPIACVTLVE